MLENTRKRIVTPAGIELTLEAEKHVTLKKSDILLSMGCGTGELESYLAEKYGSTVIGIDRDEELIRIASRKNLKNLHFFKGNGESLVYDDSYFDYIYSCGAVAAFFDKGVSEAYPALEKLNYLKYREYIGIGLFILEKGPVPGPDLYQI